MYLNWHWIVSSATALNSTRFFLLLRKMIANAAADDNSDDWQNREARSISNGRIKNEPNIWLEWKRRADEELKFSVLSSIFVFFSCLGGETEEEKALEIVPFCSLFDIDYHELDFGSIPMPESRRNVMRKTNAKLLDFNGDKFFLSLLHHKLMLCMNILSSGICASIRGTHYRRCWRC